MKLPVVLQGRDFRRLLIGQAASGFGDWMGTIALMALVLDVTGSPTAVGGVLALRLMPSLFAGPLATGAAMRWDRRRIMMTMDLCRAAVVVLIPLVEALWWIYALAFLVEVGNLVFLPARDAAIPDLVDDDHLPVANGLILVSSYGNIPVGAAAFAGLTSLTAVVGGAVADHPYVLVFAVDALTYLVSFSMIRSLRLTGSGDELADDGGASTLRTFINAFRLPLLRSVLPGLSTVILGAGALFSLGVVYVEEVLGATTVEFGFLIAIFGVGAAVAVGWVQTRSSITINLIRGGVVTMGVVLAVMSLLSEFAVALGVAVVFGGAAATALVGGISFLQQQLQGRQRVLGFTAFHLVLRAGMSLSALGAGFAAERLAAVQWPVVGRVAPTALVMFVAGVLVVIGGLTIRPAAAETAATQAPR